MTTKEAVIDLIRRHPDDVSLTEIMEELFFRCQVDEGLRQLDAGEAIEHEEVRRRFSSI